MDKLKFEAYVARKHCSLDARLKDGVRCRLKFLIFRRVVSNAPYRAIPQYCEELSSIPCSPAGWKKSAALKYGWLRLKGSRRDLHAMMHRADLPRRELHDTAHGT